MDTNKQSFKKLTNKYPKSSGCLSAIFMYIALFILVSSILGMDGEEFGDGPGGIICLVIGCGYGFYVYKKSLMNVPEETDSNKQTNKPKFKNFLKGCFSIIAFIFIVFVGYVIVVESFNLNRNESTQGEVRTLTKEQLFYHRIDSINSEIYVLEKELDEIIASQSPFFFNGLMYMIKNKRKRWADIDEEIRLLEKQLPIGHHNTGEFASNKYYYADILGNVKLKEYGRYTFIKKNPSFSSNHSNVVYSNEKIEALRSVVSYNALLMIQKEVPFFEGNFDGAIKECEYIHQLKRNRANDMRSKKKIDADWEIISNNEKRLMAVLEKYKNLYPEDWMHIRLDYEEGYLHSIQLGEIYQDEW